MYFNLNILKTPWTGTKISTYSCQTAASFHQEVISFHEENQEEVGLVEVGHVGNQAVVEYLDKRCNILLSKLLPLLLYYCFFSSKTVEQYSVNRECENAFHSPCSSISKEPWKGFKKSVIMKRAGHMDAHPRSKYGTRPTNTIKPLITTYWPSMRSVLVKYRTNVFKYRSRRAQ